MKARFGLLSLALILAISLGRRESSSIAADPEKPAAPGFTPQFLGAGSCSASACHNAGFASRTTRAEYTTWLTRDPHARAYEVLFEKRSADIQKNLQRTTPAPEDQRCLSCHVTPEYQEKAPPSEAPSFKNDGVGCESCHGPAKNWINLHYLDTWQLKTAFDKKRLGMNDTRSLTGRVQVCVRCHVGEGNRDVDHDLIAAGHPRLNFEFAAFHAHLPRHWPDEKDRARIGRDFEARAWLVGQIATAHAGLELLAHRATDEARTWPEFAEYDCAACHQELRATPKARGPKLGVMPWGNQVSLVPDVLNGLRDKEKAAKIRKALATLEVAMTKSPRPDRAQIAPEAKAAARLLAPLLEEIESAEIPTDLLTTLLAKPAQAGVDRQTQIGLALAALYRAHVDLTRPLPPGLRERTRTLDASNFEPAAIRTRLFLLQHQTFKKDL